MRDDFLSLYLEYADTSECPTFYHRWSGITAFSAYLGRRAYYPFGHSNIYPNIYSMLIGSPGTKKSTAIKLSAKFLRAAGYTTFGAKRTRQEKFLMDLAESQEDPEMDELDKMDEQLFGDLSNHESKPPAECFIAADEFNNFIGQGNLDFISLLGELWDWEGLYDHKLKNSKSVVINEPTITILGGNTPTNFRLAFPVDTLGQGFFSRLLLIYAEPTGKKITRPPPADLKLQAELITRLHSIKDTVQGEMKATKSADLLIEKIYQAEKPIPDMRFEHYSNRRFTHLLKMCFIAAASRGSTIITEDDIIYANTILTFTEGLMPKALGEFGRSRQSEVVHKVMQVLEAATLPMSFKKIWKHVLSDLEKREQLMDILMNLSVAEKIIAVPGKANHFLPRRQEAVKLPDDIYDSSILTEQERNLLCQD